MTEELDGYNTRAKRQSAHRLVVALGAHWQRFWGAKSVEDKTRQITVIRQILSTLDTWYDSPRKSTPTNEIFKRKAF